MGLTTGATYKLEPMGVPPSVLSAVGIRWILDTQSETDQEQAEACNLVEITSHWSVHVKERLPLARNQNSRTMVDGESTDKAADNM